MIKKQVQFVVKILLLALVLVVLVGKTDHKEVKTDVKNQSAQIVDVNNNDRVTKVIDGDTLQVMWRGKKESIRLIGVNTPEIVDPEKPAECFGEEASVFVKNSVAKSKGFTLQQDSSQDERDKYGRLLGYLFLDNDEISLNEKIIREGYGYEYTYKKPYQYQSQFRVAESEAREQKRGLWADGVCYTK